MAKDRMCEFETWKSVTLKPGTLKGKNTPKGIKKELKRNDIKTSRWSRKVLKGADVTGDTRTLDLVKVSVELLGFSKKASLKKIYKKSREYGLSLCTPDLGFMLWLLDSKLLPCEEEVIIAMEPIGASDDAGILVLRHDTEGRYVLATHGDPNIAWGIDRQFVFIHHRE